VADGLLLPFPGLKNKPRFMAVSKGFQAIHWAMAAVSISFTAEFLIIIENAA
jgi:hypothetical protein